MKIKVLLVVMGMLALTALSLADEQTSAPTVVDQKENVQADHAIASSEAIAEEANKPIEVGNKICPVSKEKVGQMGEIVTYEYNGKVYNLCCKMCIKDFNKDPESFSKKAEEMAQEEKIENSAVTGNPSSESEVTTK